MIEMLARRRGTVSFLLALSAAVMLCSAVQCEQFHTKIVNNNNNNNNNNNDSNDIEKMEMEELMHINDQLAAEKEWHQQEQEVHRQQFDYSQNRNDDLVVDGLAENNNDSQQDEVENEQQLYDLVETERARMRERERKKRDGREAEEELVEGGEELDDETEQSMNMNRVQRALLRAGKRALLRAGRSLRFPSSRAERFGNGNNNNINNLYQNKLRFFVDNADINENEYNEEDNEDKENLMMEQSSRAMPKVGKRALLRAGKRELLRAGKRGLLRAGKKAAFRKASLLRPGRHVPGWRRFFVGK